VSLPRVLLSLPHTETRPQGGQHDDAGFEGWPLGTPSPEGVRCVLGAEETLGSERRDVKSKRRAPPSGGPLDPLADRKSPGLGLTVTVGSRCLSALPARVLSYLAARLKDPQAPDRAIRRHLTGPEDAYTISLGAAA
jgi:hypothetical protein